MCSSLAYSFLYKKRKKVESRQRLATFMAFMMAFSQINGNVPL